MSTAIEVPTVNYHLWRPCNMRCEFCFATFEDIDDNILPEGHLRREKCLVVVESLAHAGFRKINFAGGEPTLCPWLPDLIILARKLGLTTSVVTNGSRVTREWVDGLNGCLDWAALLALPAREPHGRSGLGVPGASTSRWQTGMSHT